MECQFSQAIKVDARPDVSCDAQYLPCRAGSEQTAGEGQREIGATHVEIWTSLDGYFARTYLVSVSNALECKDGFILGRQEGGQRKLEIDKLATVFTAFTPCAPSHRSHLLLGADNPSLLRFSPAQKTCEPAGSVFEVEEKQRVY